MSLSLSSISLLTQKNAAKPSSNNFLTKYNNIFNNNVTAYVEISYTDNTNAYLSFKLDFKDVLKTLYTDLTALLYAVSSTIIGKNYLTEDDANSKYVRLYSTNAQIINSKILITKDTVIDNGYLTVTNKDITVTGGNIIVNKSGSSGGSITANTLTANSDTKIKGNLTVGASGAGNTKTLTTYGKVDVRNTSNNTAVYLYANPTLTTDFNIYTSGTIKVDSTANLTAECAKWS